MITTLPAKPARSTTLDAATLDDYVSGPRTVNVTLAPDYQLLGLRPREARVEVIREAVHQAASQLQARDGEDIESRTDKPAELLPVANEQRLSEIAVAGYRLLDPRRRRTLFERVQLLMWTEEELDVNLKSLWAVQPEAPPKVKIQLRNARRPSDVSESVSREDENQVALELFRTMRQRDRRALALWVGIASVTLSLASALALFAVLA